MPEVNRLSEEALRFDVIVVGAGMAGSAAAAVAARGGLKTALIERGPAPGSKNFFGGALYPHALLEIYPDLWDRKPPLERPVTESGFWFLSRDGMVRLTVSGGLLARKPADAYVALRAKFDPWWAAQAQAEGAFLIPRTTVVDFLRGPDGKVNGVLTDRPQGGLRAPLVIVCEGVNNLLCQKLGLIAHDVRPAGVALAVKQLIQLPAETIQNRFGLANSEQGLAVTIMGDLSMGLTGEGFIYTGQECLSVGVGVELDQLADNRIRPYELLERFLRHPSIAPLVAGGKPMEYGGHLIPESGWRDMPALCTDGVLVAGDAGNMVGNLHWEGTNMAIVAGKEAAETALEAHRRKDFSKSVLAGYRTRLQKRFVLQDLRQFRNLGSFLAKHPSFLDVYPSFLNDALGAFFTGFGTPKRKLYWDIFRRLTRRRNMLQVAGDLASFGRAVLGF